MSPARTKLLAAVLLLAVAALGVTGYAFRHRLGEIPLVGSLIVRDTDGSQPGTTAGSPTSPPATGPHGMSPAGTPPAAETARGAVSLDLRRQQLIGVQTVPVTRTVIAPLVRAVGVVRSDETRLADINVKVEGWIRELHVDYTGRLVQKGEPLFTLYSPELLTTQHEYLLALKSRDQLRQSQIEDVRERAERLVEAARQRLTLWDLPLEQIQGIEETREPLAAVTFRSPVSGFVIEKQALQGMHVDAGQTLYRIADLSVVWVEADVYESELPSIRTGGAATVTLDAYPGQTFGGRVIFVYPTVEERTRTVKVRIQLGNRGYRLKPGMYANVELRGASTTGLAVPTNALLDAGTEQVVFVAEGDGYFTPRRVRVGRRLADTVEVLSGLKEGEQVATGATFFLDSESQLRAALQGYEAPAPAPGAAVPSASRPLITFRSQPDPPQTGENTFEVTVRAPSGEAIADGDVSVVFFMPAMPTMNMPAMRSETKLSPSGGGAYRGSGQVLMAGRWDVTVTVSRRGERLGSQQLAVVAK
jgi:Cu(I)/Ag(I) efflux system membrane fusion protein/cobalt-zinc-cadmium efflux system membrane fusion protein